jgi:bifunctional non-homologous end joining protein LigD
LTRPTPFIAPCLPTKAPQPPTGGAWLHEIKHDSYRIIARKDGVRIRLYSRPGNDLTYRFSLIVEAVNPYRSRSAFTSSARPSASSAPAVTRALSLVNS